MRQASAADEPTLGLVELEAAFDRALGTMWMAFQPIVVASNHQRFGYEALMRSRDPQLPHVGALLDAAERLERTALLGRAVRAQVASLTFTAAAVERGLVFVKLHLRDLFDPTLSSPFAPLTRLARRVVLEITERTSLDGVDRLGDRVAEGSSCATVHGTKEQVPRRPAAPNGTRI